MTNKEKCAKAVAAFHIANPDTEVESWSQHPEHEDVAVLIVNGEEIAIKYDEWTESYIDAQASKASTSRATKPPRSPQYIKWSSLDSHPSGAVPVLLNIIGASMVIIGIIILLLSFNILYLVIGMALCVMFSAAAAIVKELRLTRAQNDYLIRLVEYQQALEKWKNQQ